MLLQIKLDGKVFSDEKSEVYKSRKITRYLIRRKKIWNDYLHEGF